MTLKKIQYRENDEIYKRKWEFITSSSHITNNNKQQSHFLKLKLMIKNDILDEIKLILNRLKKAGLKRAIIVDLTNPNIGIPVVRIIVPGLETFEVAKLYTNTNLFLGKEQKHNFGRFTIAHNIKNVED